MVVIAVIFIAALLFLPALARLKAKASRVKCVNNLKNVGLAFRIFAVDHADRFPFEASGAEGATLGLTNDIIAQFRALSNELARPSILNCPNRTMRQPLAHDWPTLARSNISYYVALTARTALPNSILSGDAGFSIDGLLATNRIVQIHRGARVEYPPSIPRKRGRRKYRVKRRQRVRLSSQRLRPLAADFTNSDQLNPRALVLLSDY